jgi:surfeit locus 1 family protein
VLALLRTPRWAVLTTVVIGLATLFVNLGLWQLRRLEESRTENQVMSARLEAEPLPLSDMITAAGDDLASLEYRRVVVEGSYLREGEVLVRNMVHDGAAGFRVITPLETPQWTVPVDRGWVPLEMDTPPVVAAAPPAGDVTVEGVVRLSQERPAVGPVDPEGATVVSRVEVDRLAAQYGAPTAPIWVQIVDQTADSLPIPTELPDFSDQGPHLGYALQWFGFAAVAIVGHAALLRSSARGRR